MRLIAHQGTRVYAPENSIPGYIAAAKMGYYAINFARVRASADNILYIMHDETVDRTTDGSGYIADITSEEINRLHIIKKEDYAEYRISDFNKEELHVPTLEDGIRICREYNCLPMIRLGIEESENKAAFENLYALIKKYDIGNKMMLSGSAETMLALNEKYPEAPKIIYLPKLSASEAVEYLNSFPFPDKGTVYAMLKPDKLTANDLQILKRAGYGTYSSNPKDTINPDKALKIYKELNKNGCEYANAERITEI